MPKEEDSTVISGDRLVDMISKQAVQTIGRESIISLHEPTVLRLPKPGTPPVKKLQASHLRVVAKPAGIITREMLETYAKYGFDLNTDVLKEANSQSGGHPSARFGIDLLQADSMTRIVNTKVD
jgi:hypothetical protein